MYFSNFVKFPPGLKFIGPFNRLIRWVRKRGNCNGMGLGKQSEYSFASCHSPSVLVVKPVGWCRAHIHSTLAAWHSGYGASPFFHLRTDIFSGGSWLENQVDL